MHGDCMQLQGVSQLLSATAAAAALHCSRLSGQYWLRAACQRLATLDVRRDIDMWQPPRCHRLNVCGDD